jgi:hypothetical protein
MRAHARADGTPELPACTLNTTDADAGEQMVGGWACESATRIDGISLSPDEKPPSALLAACGPVLEVLHRPGKQSLATADVAGFRYVLERDAVGVAARDADFSRDPCRLPALLAAMDQAGRASVSREGPGGCTPAGRAPARLGTGACPGGSAASVARLMHAQRR